MRSILLLLLVARCIETIGVDLRSSRALILSNISTGTGSVLIRCRPEGICCDAAFRMMVRKIFSPFDSLLDAVFCSGCPLSSSDVGPSLPSLS